MEAGAHGAKITPGLLLANPFEEGLKLRCVAQHLERRIELLQLDVRERCVKLLVAGFAKSNALLSLAAAGFGMEMMQGDQLRRNFPTAQFTSRRSRSVLLHGLVGNPAGTTGG